MRVTYKEPDIYQQFEQARQDAKNAGLQIDSFVITVDEFAEFIDLAADIDSLSFLAL